MPQIPLFNPSQRLEPGSPVAATSPEGSAGNLAGNVQEAFGNALFNFGNKLDEVGKSAKSQSNAIEATILANQFKILMVKAKAETEADPVNHTDSADGMSGVGRFQQRLKEPLDQLTAQASSKEVQQKFLSLIGDDIAAGSSTILANEIKKREENLPLMRQENLNGKARLARSDYRIAPIAASEWEADALADPTIKPADLPSVIAEGKKHIGKEAIFGIIDNLSNLKGKPGTTADAVKRFYDAENALQTDWNLVFNQKEKDQISKDIKAAREDYFTQNWKIITQNEKLDELDRTHKNRVAELKYVNEFAKAGADQIRVNNLIQQVQKDQDLLPQTKEALTKTTSKVFAEVSNDQYEIGFLGKLYTDKNMTTESLLQDLEKASISGTINNDEHIRLMQKVHERADRNAKNPGLTGIIKGAEDTIKSHYGVSIFDPEDILYKDVNGQLAAKAIYKFRQEIYKQYADGTINGSTIDKARISVIKGEGFVETKTVNNAPISSYKDSKEADKTLQALVEDKAKNWGAKTPEERKTWLKNFSHAQYNRDVLRKKEKNDINVTPSGGSKVIGD